MSATMLAGIIMVVSIVFLLVIGAPISTSIGFGSALGMLIILPADKAFLMSAQRMFTGINSFALLAIPFFVLAGNIMNNGGIAKKLVGCAQAISGPLPGPLAQANVVANMLFGAISGSGAAAAAAMGATIGPLEEDEGYDKAFSAAVNIASAPTGMLIPPSNTLIVYSTVAGSVSISALFMAGYLPGILWGLGNMVVAGIMASKRGYINKDKRSAGQIFRMFIDAIPSLLLIVIVIGGILIGVFTPTEGSAIAVVYALILSFIYRSIKVSELPTILLDAGKMTGIIIYLIGVSSIMSYVMTFTKIPTIIANALLGLTNNQIIILLIMNILLLFIGCVMDPTPAILIFTPIFLPICQQFGMHPVQFGIIITFNLCIGTITPPVGNILFVGCKVSNISIEGVIKTLLPYFAVTAVILLLVTYVAPVSMLIPSMLGLIS